jgi:hypothetical protein
LQKSGFLDFNDKGNLTVAGFARSSVKSLKIGNDAKAFSGWSELNQNNYTIAKKAIFNSSFSCL